MQAQGQGQGGGCEGLEMEARSSTTADAVAALVVAWLPQGQGVSPQGQQETAQDREAAGRFHSCCCLHEPPHSRCTLDDAAPVMTAHKALCLHCSLSPCPSPAVVLPDLELTSVLPVLSTEPAASLTSWSSSATQPASMYSWWGWGRPSGWASWPSEVRRLMKEDCRGAGAGGGG